MIKQISTVTRNVSRAAGDNVTLNLPVNPTSFLLLSLRILNGIGATTLAQVLDTITAITVTYKGTSILSMSLHDLMRMSVKLWGKALSMNNLLTASQYGHITIPIPFARKPYMKDEGFPATRSGEFQINLVYQSAFAGNIAGLAETITAVELLDADPKKFIKMTKVFDQAVTIGDTYDVELPIGNPLLAIMMRGTSLPGAANTATIRRAKLLVDNVEYGVSSAEFEALLAEGRLRHERLDITGAYTLDEANYNYMDFDPQEDDSFAIPTEGRASVVLRLTTEVADNVRVIPVELVTVK